MKHNLICKISFWYAQIISTCIIFNYLQQWSTGTLSAMTQSVVSDIKKSLSTSITLRGNSQGFFQSFREIIHTLLKMNLYWGETCDAESIYRQSTEAVVAALILTGTLFLFPLVATNPVPSLPYFSAKQTAADNLLWIQQVGEGAGCFTLSWVEN